jgi:hypothetical protein
MGDRIDKGEEHLRPDANKYNEYGVLGALPAKIVE